MVWAKAAGSCWSLVSALCVRRQGSSQCWRFELASFNLFFATPSNCYPCSTLINLSNNINWACICARVCVNSTISLLRNSHFHWHVASCSIHYDSPTTLSKKRYISGRFCGVEARRSVHTLSYYYTRPITACYLRYIINKRHVEREYAQ